MILVLGGNLSPVSVSKGSLGAGVAEPVGLGAKIQLLLTFLGTSSGKCNEGARQTQGPGTFCGTIPCGSLAACHHGLCHTSYLSLHKGPRVLTHSLLCPVIIFSHLESHFLFGPQRLERVEGDKGVWNITEVLIIVPS